MKKITDNLPFRLLLGAVLSIIVGQLVGSDLMHVVVTIKCTLSQVIVFCVPLITIGLAAPSITRLGNNTSKMLGAVITITCVSPIGAALFSMIAGFFMIPHLSTATEAEGSKNLPAIVLQLDIPQIMPVTNTLVSSLFLGLAATWTGVAVVIQVLEESQQIVLFIVTKVVILILPVFITFTLCALSYKGTITEQLPVFLQVVIIVMTGHYIWLALLYAIGDVYSGKNPSDVIKNYGPAYITTIGTVSSVATLAVALHYAKKPQPPLKDDMVDFGIPLFANICLCSSVLTEIFSVMTISKILYRTIPSLSAVILFCALLDVFAIGAPGVSGGTVMTSLGLITGVLGFDETGTAPMLAIFTPRDSFRTACNVIGGGALTMTLTGFVERRGIKRQKIENGL